MKNILEIIKNKTGIFSMIAIITGLSLVVTFSVLAHEEGSFHKDRKILDEGVLDYSSGGTVNLKILSPTQNSYTVIAEAESTVTAGRGTKFDIPKDAFVFENGEKVKGNVEFKVIEVIDDFDFITSGVDLTATDENGQTVYFESAGMFNVSAEQRGRKLKLAPGKKIIVQFPNIVPGDDFFVYKMNKEGKWEKHGHNQEVGPQKPSQLLAQDPNADSVGTTTSETDYYSTNVGVRVYAIDGMTWWNFDKPDPRGACVKGKVKGAPVVDEKKPFYLVFTLGVNYKGALSGYAFNGEFKMMALRAKQIKVLVVTKGYVGITNVIQLTKKTGHARSPEGPKNYCHDVGTIEVHKVDANILKNKKAFQGHIGLSEENYNIDYTDIETPTEESRPAGDTLKRNPDSQ
ncbi:MAG: hypothetical protein ABUK01_04615 [Leptospirales bacterium]